MILIFWTKLILMRNLLINFKIILIMIIRKSQIFIISKMFLDFIFIKFISIIKLWGYIIRFWNCFQFILRYFSVVFLYLRDLF